ncbi:right-handed parallel beta-helix repeat-containing protein [Paenibacillus sp. JDR-2]|uniref:right-handed parallel beta-helix repeat-containing protein n=1 Tax=Paenibacillus sp. (strain JDR-2) TaxID=324057 RepID=UPI00016696D3|nr:right-handed parallel beta-helix repeat-containing protein [Paenibacillus sp. JDR-2]ACT01641.1 Alpha-galactosidase [Paenibacillus sp. JDR-2]
MTIHENPDLASVKVISLADFGDAEQLQQNAGEVLRRAIEAAGAQDGPIVLEVPFGTYHFYPEHADKAAYYITNTASEEENPDITRTIALLMKGLRNFTLEGNGSLFVIHGKQTMLLLDGCENMEIRNLRFDYARPTVTEMTVERCGEYELDVRVHPDSQYKLEDGRLTWVGEGWTFREGPVQHCDINANRTWRVDDWPSRAERVEEIGSRRLRYHFADKAVPDVLPGITVQMRDGIRDQVGILIAGCKRVRLTGLGIHFMHGLGVVGQFSEELTFTNLELAPRTETGRTVTGFADFIHLSGCRGLISITDSRFAGAHDDAINIHGTYLRIVGQPASNQVQVRFMHPQTYGFQAFFPGDEVAFVSADSLASYAAGRVAAVERLNSRELLLTLEQPAPILHGEQDVIENLTWSPEIVIEKNHFARIPTRGILVTSPRKTIIRDNRFEGIHMNGILVAADANSWYESGAVTDLLITGNHFGASGGAEHPIIRIAPENELSISEVPVHRNIRIEGNRFEVSQAALLSARSTEGLVFSRNEILVERLCESVEEPDASGFFAIESCSGVEIEGNTFHIQKS